MQGKETIVVKHALARPQSSTKQDDFVGRMLWALSDKSGLPAKRFADFNPTPSLDWLLEAFTDERFRHDDLIRFQVPPREEVDAKLTFSLTRRPAPYNRAPQMLLASGRILGCQWDDLMFHLARWLTRHLNDPRLVIWIAEHGGKLHDSWSWLIEQELERFASLEQQGKTAELDEIRQQSPNAIPSSLMCTLWRLLLSERVKLNNHIPDLYRWKKRLKWERLTTTLRLELRGLLAPMVTLKSPLYWDDDNLGIDEPVRVKQLVDWEMVLATDHVHSTLCNLTDQHWVSALPELLDDLQQLLRDALDLLRELGEADDRHDRSHWDLSSILPHRQNRGFRDWVSLIELLRDAWLSVYGSNSQRATLIAQSWFELPYPTFKRLAFFAASKDGCIQPERWVDWLLADDAWWLWSTETGREVFRLLVLQGQHLAGAPQERLEAAILAGPPRGMYRDDLEPERWQRMVSRSIWLHLAKLKSSNLTLGATAAAQLTELSAFFPQWQLAENERDEFSHWMSGTGDPDFEDNRDVDIAPSKRQELTQWLTKPLELDQRPCYEDTWRDACLKHPLNCLFALVDLAAQGNWLTGRWRDALNAWSSERKVQRLWRYAAPQVQNMPDAVIQEISHAVTWWMKAASKSINYHRDILMSLCRRVMALPLAIDTGMTINGEPVDRPVTEAINHPIGHVTQTLLNLWFQQKPNDNDLLPADIAPLFTQICDVQESRLLHGRVILCSRLITFFRVDRPWTEQYLLPLFSWNNRVEARAAWEGFLWSPRLY